MSDSLPPNCHEAINAGYMLPTTMDSDDAADDDRIMIKIKKQTYRHTQHCKFGNFADNFSQVFHVRKLVENEHSWLKQQRRQILPLCPIDHFTAKEMPSQHHNINSA